MALDRAQIPLGSMMDNHGPVLLRRSSASKCEPTKVDLPAKVVMLVQKKKVHWPQYLDIFGHKTHRQDHIQWSYLQPGQFLVKSAQFNPPNHHSEGLILPALGDPKALGHLRSASSGQKSGWALAPEPSMVFFLVVYTTLRVYEYVYIYIHMCILCI